MNQRRQMLKWLVTGIAIIPVTGFARRITQDELPNPVLNHWKQCKKEYGMGISADQSYIVDEYFHPKRVTSWYNDESGYLLVYTNKFGHQLSFEKNQNSFVHRIVIR